MMRLPQRHKMRGQIAILTATIVLPLLILALGLGIDFGLGYLLKARLSLAVDSAGVAAARAVTQGATRSEQEANARLAAKKYFDANIAGGYLGATVTWNDPDISYDKGLFTIVTSASANLEVSLLKYWDFKFLDVGAQAQTVRKDLDMVFVIDTTGSLSSVQAQVKASAQTFLSKFNVTSDRVALVHFSVGSVVDVPFKPDQSRGFDRTTMNTKINGYVFGSTTNYSEGLWQARNQLNNAIQLAQRSSLRVIIFFSDGAPNAFGSYFSFKTPSDCTLPGVIITGDTASGTPQGLFKIDQQDQRQAGNCYRGSSITTSALNNNAVPPWYNAHGAADQEFSLVPAAANMRPVDNTATWANLNRIARNLAEEMADKSRAEGIYIYTLGLGPQARSATGPDGETGETLLKNMAHTVTSSKFNLPQYAGQPVGDYCWAEKTEDLGPCFAQLASQILRISR